MVVPGNMGVSAVLKVEKAPVQPRPLATGAGQSFSGKEQEVGTLATAPLACTMGPMFGMG